METQSDAVIHAIQMRMNYIETGNPNYGAVDVEASNSGAYKGKPQTLRVKPLSREQRDLLNVLEDAIKTIRKKGAL